MKPLIVIKLGGSVITFKESKVPKVRLSAIRQLVQDAAQLVKSGKYRIVLVHGGGSFGHPIVKENDLHKGMETAQQKLAYARTNQNMLDLNEFIVKSLIDQSVPAVSFPPHSFATQRAGKFKDFSSDIIKKCLEEGLVPVLFGDAVFDDIWGCSILSGDTIISFLAKKLKAHKVVFLTDVDGVFDKNPKNNPGAKLISEINGRNLKGVLKLLKTKDSSSVDVTGEMYGKVLAMSKNLKGITMVITNGFNPQSVISAVEEKSIGTRLRF